MSDPAPPRPRVLVVDDEPGFADFVAEALDEMGYAATVANRPSDGLACLADAVFDVAVLDLNLPEMGGLELARRIKAQSPDTQIVVLTGHADTESAIEGIREGIFDYLQKGSLKATRLEKSVREAAARRRLALENRELVMRLAESNHLLTTLHELAAGLAGERYLDRVLERVVASARSLLSAERARLLLFQPSADGEMVVLTGAGDGADTLPGTRVNPAEGIACVVAGGGEAVLLERATDHPARSGRIDLEADGPGFVCAPIRSEGVLGALSVAGRSGLRLEHAAMLERLARQAAVAIENAQHHDQAINFFTHASEILVSFLEKMDPLYAGHSRGTAVLSDMLSRRLGFDEARRRAVHFGALLHDIGKVRLPAELLVADAPLSEAQRKLLRRHPRLGMELLKPISAWREILPIVHAHHERWDGAGYPLGLAGDQIPLGARVVAIAEAFDAMTRRTPHTPTRSLDEAIAEVERCAGSQFDPQMVRLFVAELRQRGDPRAPD